MPQRSPICYWHYQDRIDARSDDFTRYEYSSHLLDESREVISTYLNVPLNICVLVPSASTAFNTVLRNLVFEPGDVVLCFDTVYKSFEFTLQCLTETTPTRYIKISIDLAISNDHICEGFEANIVALRANRETPRLAVFDTISPFPAA